MRKPDDVLMAPMAAASASTVDTAAEWFVYLRSGLATERDLATFRDWVEESSDNKEALNQLGLAWEEVGPLAMELELNLDLVGQERVQKPLTSKPRRKMPGWTAPLALAASMTLVVALAFAFLNSTTIDRHEFTTGVGEIRSVELVDGTTITLSARTVLESRISRSTRAIELKRGRAFFEVAKDEERPFVVAIGNAEVEVLGTTFDVDLRSADVRVAVESGLVTVTSLGDGDKRSNVVLEPGQEVNAFLSGGLGVPQSFDVDSLSWRSGNLSYVDTRLEDVVAEVNRYRKSKIRILDPDLKDVRVSFSIPQDRTDILLAGLEATLPVRIGRSELGVTVSRTGD